LNIHHFCVEYGMQGEGVDSLSMWFIGLNSFAKLVIKRLY